MFNLVHLQTLRAVLATGSLSGAGKELGYTTSAVSQQIAALERTAGVQLFERGAHSLRPTDAARRLGAHADTVLARLEEAEQDMAAFSAGRSGFLRIAAFSTVSAQVLPRALARLTARLPDAKLSVVDDWSSPEVAQGVHDGRVDLGVVHEYELVPHSWPPELQVVPVLDEDLVLIHGANRLPGAPAPVALADLEAQVWAATRDDTVAFENLQAMCADSGFRPDVRFQSNDYDVIRGMVRAGLGVAIVPVLALGNDSAITMRRLRDGGSRRMVVCLYRPTDPNPLLPEAITAIRRAAREFARWTFSAFPIDRENPIARPFSPAR